MNLRKPLCNLGSHFAAEIHGARVVLQGCWHVITDSVGAVVEVRPARVPGRCPAMMPLLAFAGSSCL